MRVGVVCTNNSVIVEPLLKDPPKRTNNVLLHKEDNFYSELIPMCPLNCLGVQFIVMRMWFSVHYNL